MVIHIDLSGVADEEDLFIRFYNALGINDPHGLNWDAFYDNIRDVAFSTNLKLSGESASEVVMVIQGYEGLEKLSKGIKYKLNDLLLSATDPSQRNDDITLMVRLGS